MGENPFCLVVVGVGNSLIGFDCFILLFAVVSKGRSLGIKSSNVCHGYCIALIGL